jgi:hypothetical protein
MATTRIALALLCALAFGAGTVLVAGCDDAGARSEGPPTAEPTAGADTPCAAGAGKGDGETCKNKDCPCKPGQGDGESSKVDCVCARGKAGEPVWCKACNVGYVDGKRAGCPGCVEKALKKLEAARSAD